MEEKEGRCLMPARKASVRAINICELFLATQKNKRNQRKIDQRQIECFLANSVWEKKTLENKCM